MKTYMSVEEFVAFIGQTLTSVLERDHGKKDSHIVDLSASASTVMETIFFAMDAYPREKK